MKLTPDICKALLASYAHARSTSIDLADLYLLLHNKNPSEITFSSMDLKIVEFLQENGWTLFSSQIRNTSTNSDSDSDYGYDSYDRAEYNFHSNIAAYPDSKYPVAFINIKITRVAKIETATLHYYYNIADDVDKFLELIKPFCILPKERKSSFGVLVKENMELIFKDFNSSLTEPIDIELHYGKEFAEVHYKQILEKIKTEKSGLYILNGPPGNAKSFFLKHLALQFPDKKFLYIPEFMVGSLSTPEMFTLLLNYKNSIMVIEDAENVVKKRDESNQSLVSIILNLSDGILSDILQIPIFFTYNTDNENIDEAIKRPGRLKYIHEFKPLSIEESNKLLAHRGITDFKADKPMSVAEIYSIEKSNNNKPVVEKKLGFDQ